MISEKVKEIKKALECCKYRLCEVCQRLKQEPNQEEDCRLALVEQTLTLINELESENERLLEQRNKTYNIWVKDTEKLKDRIAELEKEVETRKEEVLHLQEYGKKLISETELKQFAESLKEKVKNFCGTEYENAYYDVTKSFACNDIDETLKEFLK